MKLTKGILVGILIYLALFFGEKGVHYIYFYATHEFGTSNLLLIKSSLMINFAPIVAGIIAGFISRRGLISGFVTGAISGLIILLHEQLTGANPFNQEFTPSILFDEVFTIGCIAAVSGAAGELLKMKHMSRSYMNN